MATTPGWLYILRCADGSYYVGSTTNLAVRVAEHESGIGCEYTSQRLPVKLVYSQEFQDYQQAFVRERQVKGWSRAKKECLIRGDFDRLVSLSKSRNAKDEGGSTSSP